MQKENQVTKIKDLIKQTFFIQSLTSWNKVKEELDHGLNLLLFEPRKLYQIFLHIHEDK